VAIKDLARSLDRLHLALADPQLDRFTAREGDPQQQSQKVTRADELDGRREPPLVVTHAGTRT
jgi:hypothetical protein